MRYANKKIINPLNTSKNQRVITETIIIKEVIDINKVIDNIVSNCKCKSHKQRVDYALKLIARHTRKEETTKRGYIGFSTDLEKESLKSKKEQLKKDYDDIINQLSKRVLELQSILDKLDEDTSNIIKRWKDKYFNRVERCDNLYKKNDELIENNKKLVSRIKNYNKMGFFHKLFNNVDETDLKDV